MSKINNNNNKKKRTRRVNFTTYLKDHQGRMKIPQTTNSLEASQSEKDHVWPKRRERKRKEKKKNKRNKKSIFQGVRRIEIQGS